MTNQEKSIGNQEVISDREYSSEGLCVRPAEKSARISASVTSSHEPAFAVPAEQLGTSPVTSPKSGALQELQKGQTLHAVRDVIAQRSDLRPNRKRDLISAVDRIG